VPYAPDTSKVIADNLGKTKISFSPEVIAGSQFCYSFANHYTLSLKSKFVGKQYLDNTQNSDRMLNSYFLNDLQLNCHFKTRYISNIEAILKMNNILDVKYESNGAAYPYVSNGARQADVYYFPQAGRNYMIGLILSF
jgi:iron complex outermembrane receptor protein